MYHQEDCPCCGNHDKVRYWSIIAPFIKDYVKPSSNQGIASLYQCKSCTHRYFRERYDDKEMARLYSGYRGNSYLSVRRKSEPWYTSKINDINHETSIIRQRKNGIISFLTPFLNNNRSNIVIADVGGDAGQFIPLEMASHAFVVETSAEPPVPGVTRTQTITEIQHSIDLVICAHVLEHIASPTSFMSDIVSSANLSENCLFYIEVPLETYYISPLLQNSLYRQYIQLVLAMRQFTIMVDFLSVLVRGYAGVILPPFIIKLHEHLNFFTKLSLMSLARSSGLEVLGAIEEKGSYLRTHQGVIRLVARRLR